MLESNPSRTSRLVTRPNDTQRRWPLVSAFYRLDRFPHAFKNSSREGAANAASFFVPQPGTFFSPSEAASVTLFTTHC
jgi:hypothetical protein